MSDQTKESQSAAKLRQRAVTRVSGSNRPEGTLPSPQRAFAVLHDLAKSPATAADALALLHELQVHQVELDMQDDDLRKSRVELEHALVRHQQLYDAAPVACFTIERDTTLVELNLGAARLLGAERAALVGRGLNAFLDRPGSDALLALLARVAQGDTDAAGSVELVLSSAPSRRVVATATLDPAGARYLVAFTELGPRPQPDPALAAGR